MSRFAHHISASTNQFKKAIDVVVSGGAKKHVFLPSGRSIYTIVGRNGDEFIDPDKSFCSCESHFYSGSGGKSSHCYHILSYEIANEAGFVDEISLDDEEYDTFLRLLMQDITRPD